jgi:hypothetical protein
MRGMQASISTLLAREYYFPDKTWGENVPLFMRAVGSHPDRLSNLYFVFLFTLRAVVKAGDFLTTTYQQYETGNPADDEAVRTLMKQLVGMQLPADMDMNILEGIQTTQSNIASPQASYLDAAASLSHSPMSSNLYEAYRDAMTGLIPQQSSSSSLPPTLNTSDIRESTIVEPNTTAHTGVGVGMCGEAVLTAVEQCRNAFDESHLFQVPTTQRYSYALTPFTSIGQSGERETSYLELVQDKHHLLEEFRINLVYKHVSCLDLFFNSFQHRTCVGSRISPVLWIVCHVRSARSGASYRYLDWEQLLG